MEFFNCRIKKCWFIIIFVSFAVVLNLAPAIAQEIPGATTSGGMDPERKGVVTPAPTKYPKIYIPSLPDRPLGVNEGIQINVNAFNLIGIENMSYEGIYASEIMDLITFEKKLPAIYTIGHLQAVADKITEYFRAKGYILAHAFLPEQNIEKGVVAIDLIIGNLGEVLAEDNIKYSNKVLIKPFSNLFDKPVRKDEIESAMMYVMGSPGLDITGIFSKGEKVGETSLTLKVKDEVPIDFIVYADNFGSEYSGEYRVRLDAIWNNPIGMGDQLGLTALHGFHPEEIAYGAFNYKIPLSDYRYSLGLGGSYSPYGIVGEFQSLGIDGNVTKADLSLERTFIKQKDLGVGVELNFSRKLAEMEQNNAQFNTSDSLSVLSGSLRLDSIDSAFEKIGLGGGMNIASLSYSHGLGNFLGSMEAENDTESSRQGGSGEFAGGEFDKLALSMSRLQNIGKGFSGLLRLEGQWSEDLLVSLEQFSLSGPDRVRAYAPAELMRDKAWFGSAELLLDPSGLYNEIGFNNDTWPETPQISLFFDYANGELNDPIGNESDKALYGVGIGLRFSLPGGSFAKITAAKPLDRYESNQNNDNIQFYFSSSLHF